MTRRRRRDREHGQMIVIMAIGLVVMLALAGLVIDGGWAWGQQRISQNSADAAAQGGATVLAERLGGTPDPAAGWDITVKNAIENSLTLNNVPLVDANGQPGYHAYYTDICGLLLTPAGGLAASTATAAPVGSGLPTSAAITPDCPNRVPGPVAGVLVEVSKSFGTFFSGVVGINAMRANTEATAVTGFVESCQDVEQGCAILPLTASVWITTCVKNKSVAEVGTGWKLNTRYVLPFCQIDGTGTFGWLDWTPPSGGASELAESILHPNNPPITLPSWKYITATGKVADSNVEAALNTWAGQIVMFPLYDHTCASDPDQTKAAGASPYGCLPATDLDQSKGTNTWWRIPQFTAFRLEHAYTNGTDNGACAEAGTNSCLIGEFVKFVVSGQVGPGTGGGSTDSSVIGVQLIK